MKVLLINDNHQPCGGAENYFFELKKRLQTIPELEVFSLGFGDTEKSGDDYLVLKALKSKFAKLFWQLILHPRMYFTLRKQLKNIQPDIIHLHNVNQYTVSVLAAIKPYKVVQTIHDYGVICPTAHNIHKNLQPCPTGMRLACFWQHQVKYNPLAYLALTLAFFNKRRWIKKSVNTYFAPSPLLVEYLKRNYFTDATYIAPFKNKKNTISFDAIKPNHFLFAGNLGAHKGIYLLLEEFAQASQKNKQLTLTIAGMGAEKNALLKRIKELQLETRIQCLGWQENLEQEYLQCAAVIFPSLWMEAFGLVITEAMSYARPVIGSNRGSPPWIIDDKQTGLIFDPLKKGDCAEKILMLADNMELIMQYGKNGEQKLQTFIDNEKVLQQIVGVYKKRVSSHPFLYSQLNT